MRDNFEHVRVRGMGLGQIWGRTRMKIWNEQHYDVKVRGVIYRNIPERDVMDADNCPDRYVSGHYGTAVPIR